MRIFAYLSILFLVSSIVAQSGRTGPKPDATPLAPGVVATGEPTVKQMYDEANGYISRKATEYDAKKVPFSDRLFDQAKREQRQLAAKNAAIASARKDLAGEDLYYLGMLHWIALNLDGAADSLRKFYSLETAAPGRRQTARSIVVVVLAKQKKIDEAEALLAEYVKNEPTKLAERSRMEAEIAKACQSARDLVRMAPHAEEAYKAAKAVLNDAPSRSLVLDQILDDGMLVFEAYRDGGNQKKADDALDDLRATAAAAEASSLYYYAIDAKIIYLIDTGRKPQAMETYLTGLIRASKDLKTEELQSDVISRLKRREVHYKLLGEQAPELPAADQWFPGTRKTLADLKGKVVLLDFWAPWCGPCFETYPSLIEWDKDLKKDGLEILGITRYYGEINGVAADQPHEIEYIKAFKAQHGLPYDFLVAKDQSIQFLYGATALPTAVLIDRKGIIRYIETGTNSMRLDQLRETIIKLLNEK